MIVLGSGAHLAGVCRDFLSKARRHAIKQLMHTIHVGCKDAFVAKVVAQLAAQCSRHVPVLKKPVELCYGPGCKQ